MDPFRCRFGAGPIGIEIRTMGQSIQVISVQRGSASARQGVSVGDVVAELNGQAVPKGMHEMRFRSALKSVPRPLWLTFHRRSSIAVGDALGAPSDIATSSAAPTPG